MFTRTNLLIAFGVLAVLSFAIPSLPGMPKEWADYWAGLFKVIDGALLVVATKFNPNGTPAELPYEPKK